MGGGKFIWMMYNNQDTRSIGIYRTKAEYNGTAVKPATRDGYYTGKSGTCKTWHVSPHVNAKGGINKCGNHTSTYAPGTYRKKTDKISG